ncbi:MAG: class B sortase [Blautia sp.]|nr:class B sortase [Blautia sp.]
MGVEKETKRQGQKRNNQNCQNRRQRKKRKNAIREAVSVTILLIAVCVFVFSLYQLALLLIPYYTGGQEYNQVRSLAIVTDKDSDDETFQVDFDALLAENPDTVGWIRFEEPSVISYPIVKSSDNEEYLTKTFSANENKLGAIFMDMHNNTSFSDRNTIIYGHNLKVGGEMFSQLNAYAEEAFFKEHPYFYIYTPDGKEHTYQVFSAGIVKDTAENYRLSYASEEEWLSYLELCRNSSNYNVEAELNAQSKIVSLSTCTNVNEDERFLVQGVLIEEK